MRDLAELPPEAMKLRDHFNALGIKSTIVVAFRPGDHEFGFIGLDTIRENKSWSDEDRFFLRLVGETIASSIERKQAEKEREKFQTQLSNAVEIARLGPWEHDVDHDTFKFNDYFYKIFCTTAEEVGGYTMSSSEYAQRFLHPDDMHLVE